MEFHSQDRHRSRVPTPSSLWNWGTLPIFIAFLCVVSRPIEETGSLVVAVRSAGGRARIAVDAPNWLRRMAPSVLLIPFGYVDSVHFENRVPSSILDSLRKHARLFHVGIRETELSTSDFENLCQLTSLKSLHLSRTTVREDGLSHLKELTRLEALSLREVSVTDGTLPRLAPLQNLDWLCLSGSPVSDTDLAHLANQIKCLDLSGTGITDEGLPHLKSQTRLHVLNLGDTAVSDSGLASLQHLKSLSSLNLGDSLVTPDGVAWLKEKLPNCSIRVSQRREQGHSE